MSFASVHGQERAIKVLRSAIAADRIPGAYLFVGPPGVGKLYSARQFIKALNCRAGTGDACDECSHCRLIDKGEFPDVYEPARQGRRIIKGSAGERGTGTLTDIVSRLHYPPMMGRTKVVLIEPADGLTAEAGNMLLKTLEEPPRQTLFILVTTVESAVLPTLVSRCQRVRFPPLREEWVANFLTTVRGLPQELALSLAAASQGSIERALELHGSNTLDQKQEILDFLLSLFDSPLPERVHGGQLLLDHLTGKEREAIHAVGTVCSMLARDLIWAASGFAAEHFVLQDRGDAIVRLGRRLGRRNALAYADVARELGRGMLHNENPKNLLHFLGTRSASLGAAEESS